MKCDKCYNCNNELPESKFLCPDCDYKDPNNPANLKLAKLISFSY